MKLKIPKTDLAYIAGIVDGEGSLYIYKKFAGNPRALTKKHFRCALKITNTDTRLIDWLKSRLGGTVSGWQSGIPHRKKVFHLNIEGPKLLDIIPAILPFMIIKRSQASYVIQMQETMLVKRTGMKLPANVIQNREEIHKAFLGERK